MNFEHLKTMDTNQLKELAGKQGLNVHPRAKDDTIRKQIMENALAPQANPQVPEHKAAAPQRPVHHNTPEDVEKALAKIKDKIPQFVSSYDREENTWHFSCKGAEECGNLAIPLRVIMMKAGNVSQGRRVLVGLNDHFDRGTAGGNSAYTNSVLAG